MITHLSVRNYALIDHLEIDFQSGLSVITGETGSGKSIILGALGLALGERADHSALASSSEKCVVEVSFSIDQRFHSFFNAHDLDFESTTLIRREITKAGKSRSFVNDTPVKLQTLKHLGEMLVDIHSQQENTLLRDQNFRFDFVDAVGQNQHHRSTFQQAFDSWTSTKSELKSLEERRMAAAQDADYQEFQLKELEALDLDNFDQQEAEEQASTLNHAEEILSALADARGLMEYDQGALENIQNALSRLQSLPQNARAKELAGRLESALIELRDIASEAENWSEQIEVNPQRLAQLQGQLDALYRAQQKHRVESATELRDIRDTLSQSSLDAGQLDEEIEGLKDRLAKQEAEALSLAAELSKQRKSVIQPVQESLNELLAKLDLPNARIEIALKSQENMSVHGLDDIEINFSANPGSALKAIETVASGGEISRVMLAIKAAFGEAMQLPTLILDEIDTGVSGETARKVARVMSAMGKQCQVIAISHLPQIAGQAHHHFKVLKTTEDGVAYTTIQSLDDNQRVDEIAEMMTGKELTEAARESARTLLAE